MKPQNLMLSLGCLLVVMSHASAVDITVAPNGDDKSPGTTERPVATLAMAQVRARAAIAAGERSVRVQVRPGTYRLTQTLRFTSEDVAINGDTQWNGTDAILTSGVPLTDWAPVSPGTYACAVPTGAPHRISLARGDRAIPPSQWGPVAITAVGTRLRLAQGAPAVLGEPGAGEAVTIHAWGVCRAPAEIVSGTVLNSPGLSWSPVPELAPTPGMNLILEGVTEPGPGQWRLARGRRIELSVTDRPRDGEYVVPVLPTLLEIAGQPQAPVRHLTISGFQVRHAAWPRSASGVAGIQAGHVGFGGDPEAVGALPAAVLITWAENVTVERLLVQAVEASGIALGAGCRAVRVSHCSVEDAGGCGIVVGWRGESLRELSADWDDPQDVLRSNIIERCRVTRCARLDWGSVGIIALFARDTKILSNLIEEMPYTGLALGFRWDTSATSQRGTHVEGNHIRNVMRRLVDGAGIYTLGWQPGSFITGNLIEGIGATPGWTPPAGAPAGGLFFDNGSKGLCVENNVIGNVRGEPLRFNGCAPSWLLLGDNTVVPEGKPIPRPATIAEGVGP